MEAFLKLLDPDGEVVAEGVPSYDPAKDAVIYDGRAARDGHLATWRLVVDGDTLEGPLAAGGARVLKGQPLHYFITAEDLLHAEKAQLARQRKAARRIPPRPRRKVTIQ